MGVEVGRGGGVVDGESGGRREGAAGGGEVSGCGSLKRLRTADSIVIV